MKCGEYAPSDSPSSDAQRDALRKGLGRAVQWALTGRLHDGPLLEACLRDFRYDVQVEGSRGDWLWRMIHEVGAADRFRVPILHALYDLSEERSANQLCELARHYALGGDETFHSRLYEIVAQKPYPDSRWLGEYEIVELDGETGFLFAARVRGEQLARREWDWDDDALIDHACECFGVERVGRLLENTSDRAIAVYHDGWREHQEADGEGPNPATPLRERMAATTVDAILAAAGSAEARFHVFRSWGRYADEADLHVVLRHLWNAEEPKVIADLLQVFSIRAVPRWDARLIEFCRHRDHGVRHRAHLALENVAHPLVREYALARLEEGLRDSSVASLFINNFEQGDEHRIVDAMECPADQDQRHWLLMSLTKILDANPGAECSRLGIIAYALTPCGSCRFHAARHLLEQQTAPLWLVDECRYDSDEQSRTLVRRSQDTTAAD